MTNAITRVETVLDDARMQESRRSCTVVRVRSDVGATSAGQVRQASVSAGSVDARSCMLGEHLEIEVTTRAQSDSDRGIHSHRSVLRAGGREPGTRKSDHPIGLQPQRRRNAPEQGDDHGCGHHPPAARQRRALRTPDPSVEPEGQALHPHGAQRHPHHRPAAVAGVHRQGLRLRPRRPSPTVERSSSSAPRSRRRRSSQSRRPVSASPS